MTRGKRNSIAWGSVVIVVLLVCTGLIGPAVDAALSLTFGWAYFIGRVLPRVQVRWELVMWAIIYAAVFLVGSQLFLRWLYREVGSGAWRWRWTFSGFVVVILAFLTGMASIGITHQVGWLATSPKSIILDSWTVRETAKRIKCASHLRQIGEAINLYCKDNGGRFPEDYRVLLLKYKLSPECLVCPDSNDFQMEANTFPMMRQAAAELTEPGHCSYSYLGRGLNAPVADDQVIASELLANHSDGINAVFGDGEGANVLFGDGHVEFVEKLRLLKMLPPTTAPSTQP